MSLSAQLKKQNSYLNKKKAFFLVFALWIFVLLSLFNVGLSFQTFIEIKKTNLILCKVQAQNLAISGIAIAKAILKKDTEKDKNSGNKKPIDHLREEWAKGFKEELAVNSNRKGILTITIEDESSRINLNQQIKKEDQKQIIKPLFTFLKISDPEKKIKTILEYTKKLDTDSKNLFMAKVKNEDLSVLEELLLIKNFTYQDYNKVKNLLTIYTNDNKVNINTAKKEVIESIVDIVIDRKKILTVRFGKNMIEGDADDKYYGEGEDCNDTNNCLPFAANFPAGYDNSFSISSNTFRITSQGEVGGVKKKIICVVDRNGKILHWDEANYV